MAGNTFGSVFCVTTWGESHGAALGAVIDGCPAGLALGESDIQQALDRRKPGLTPGATPRAEEDRVEILSGVFEGRTTGTPISLLLCNADQRPSAYEELRDVFRPGHGDYTYFKKYGLRDWRGGGRASGRETAARVAAGAVAAKVLAAAEIEVLAYSVFSLSKIFVSVSPAAASMRMSARWSCSVGPRLMMTSFAPACLACTGTYAAG